MSSESIAPYFEDVTIEQERVQAKKFQGRQLREYDHYFFPGQDYREPRACPVGDFVKPLCADGDVSLPGLLAGMQEASGTPVHWVDMGGGRGLAQRQLLCLIGAGEQVRASNVDLFDWGIDDLTHTETSYLETRVPGTLRPDMAPYFIQADSATVELAEPPHVITAVESIQYLNDPLASIAHWFNQLADNGIMLISNESSWTDAIDYERDDANHYDKSIPFEDIIPALEANHINLAVRSEVDWPSGFRPQRQLDYFKTLVMQKRPGTAIITQFPVRRVWTNNFGYKTTYYDRPTDGTLLEVVTQ